jgi:hypothetical protein
MRQEEAVMKRRLFDSLSHQLRLRFLVLGVVSSALILSVACGGETEVIKEVPGEVVIQTVIVEKEVPGEKVVETVIVEKEVAVLGDTVIQTVVVSVPIEAPGAAKPSTWGGTLRLAAHGPPAHFDFYASNTIANIGSQAPMYNKLVRKIGITSDLPITGDLAHSWEISPDSKTYTFFLRDGVKFHDGSDFSAEDVKASYDRIIFPQNDLVSGRKTNFGAVSARVRPTHSGIQAECAAWPWLDVDCHGTWLERDREERDPGRHRRQPAGSGRPPRNRTVQVRLP